MAIEGLREAWDIERKAYYEWQSERNGDPVRRDDLRNRHISPKRVREAHTRWQQAVVELRKLGGYVEVMKMLNERPRSKG